MLPISRVPTTALTPASELATADAIVDASTITGDAVPEGLCTEPERIRLQSVGSRAVEDCLQSICVDDAVVVQSVLQCCSTLRALVLPFTHRSRVLCEHHPPAGVQTFEHHLK